MRAQRIVWAALLLGGAFESPLAAQCGVVKLQPDNLAGVDDFGLAVSIDGDRVLVGAPEEDAAGANSGAAYVFERQGLGWVQVARLLPDDGEPLDEFGSSVSLDGDLALVGAVLGNGVADGSGSAYLFQWTGSTWVQIAELFASDGASSDAFATSVSLHSGVALVGASSDDDFGTSSGSAYVFELQATTWVQTAKLLASDGGASDRFGSSVSVFEEVAIVGAPNHDAPHQDTGAVYVFERNPNGAWGPNETAKLVASDADVNDTLGRSVSTWGDAVLAGANGEDINTGSAYLFERTAPGQWNPSETIKLTASDAATNDSFGVSVALSGTNALVGAHHDDDNGSESGSAYMFLQDSCASWTPNETAKLVPDDGQAGDHFAQSVSLSGIVAALGAPDDDFRGTVYVFSPPVGAAFCFGDGGTCPCANGGGPDEGCANSGGTGAHLCATGSARACADDATFHGERLLPGQPALLFAGESALNNGDGLPFGDGLRCAGANVVRLGVRTPDASGRAEWGPGLGTQGGWSAGDTRYLQGWYRDPPGPCGSGFNLSNGHRITFEP